jgi:replicative DNA helicase
MADWCITTTNALMYAKIILERSRLRKLRAVCSIIEEGLHNKNKSEAILDAAGEALGKISTMDTQNSQISLDDAFRELMAMTDERANGVNEVYSTGFEELDEYMPFEGGGLYLLGGRSGAGKTTLLQSFIETQILAGIPVYFNSAEMKGQQVAKRILQSAGSVDGGFFKNPNKYAGEDPGIGARITAGLNKFKGKSLMIDQEQGLSLEKLKTRTRNYISGHPDYRKTGKGMLAVDYVQLMEYDKRNPSASLGDISKGLRALGKELNIPVILLVQLNQDHKNRQDKRPIPSDIAGSAELYRDCDGCLFAYRPIIDDPDTPDRDIMEIIAGKNRDGNPGIVRASAEMKYFRVRDFKAEYNYQG